MANTKNYTVEALKILLVGDAGTKKTRLSGSFPDPHFIDLDAGMGVLRDKEVNYITLGEKPTTDPDFLEITKNTKGKPVNERSMFEKAQHLLEHYANTLTKDQTLVLDSLTFYSRAALNHVQQQEKFKDNRKTYGVAQQLITETFEMLKNIECNVIVTAHRTLVENNEGILSYVPVTAGKAFAMTLPAYFDEVWRTCAKTETKKTKGVTEYDKKFWLETCVTRKEQGKSRVLHLPDVIEDPTYDKIMSLVDKGDN